MWLWIGIALAVFPLLGVTALLIGMQVFLRWRYLDVLMRIFQEKPLFIIPRGQPVPGAEEVWFSTRDGLQLRGCYLRPPRPRKGVILFGLEFGSNRWACVTYCEQLLEAGYDVFAFEPRNQGESAMQPGYCPLQWVTDRDAADMEAAIKYLTTRPDADPRGIGLFGISKGGSAGLLVAADNAAVRCCVTDGAYATYTTVVPYMRKWVNIYIRSHLTTGLLPAWYYGLVAMAGVRRTGQERGVRFLDLETALPRLAPRPWLMIHGGGDTYIRPEMARAVFARADEPKEFWLIPGAKHNQALHVAGEEYHRRVIDFFDKHLAGLDTTPDGAHLPPNEPPAQPSSDPALMLDDSTATARPRG
jgi:alpha-beta hydrolase superfamily lysophospholipase